jgi:hypothetical protein
VYLRRDPHDRYDTLTFAFDFLSRLSPSLPLLTPVCLPPPLADPPPLLVRVCVCPRAGMDIPQALNAVAVLTLSKDMVRSPCLERYRLTCCE